MLTLIITSGRNMEKFTLREREIFRILKIIKDFEFVIIGGYAVNAFTLPRFSVDCDLVVKNSNELDDLRNILGMNGYYKSKDFVENDVPYKNKFERWVKEIMPSFEVSLDILIDNVLDRNTKAKFSADWVFENSKVRTLKGKTIREQLKARIVNPDALFAMKLSICRQNDVRDLFLLIPLIDNKEWIKKEVSSRYEFKERLSKALKYINSKQFKDSLQGVFGMIDNKLFDKNKKLMLSLQE